MAEAAALAAVRSASSARRRELAALLVHGLSRSDTELVEEQALLRLLEQLNDPQVIILVFKGAFSDAMNDSVRDAFYEKHPEVFVRAPSMSDPPEGVRRWTMYEHYQDGLAALGLLHDPEAAAVAKRQGPRHFTITRLGRLLLAAIDLDKPDVAR